MSAPLSAALARLDDSLARLDRAVSSNRVASEKKLADMSDEVEALRTEASSLRTQLAVQPEGASSGETQALQARVDELESRNASLDGVNKAVGERLDTAILRLRSVLDGDS